MSANTFIIRGCFGGEPVNEMTEAISCEYGNIPLEIMSELKRYHEEDIPKSVFRDIVRKNIIVDIKDRMTNAIGEHTTEAIWPDIEYRLNHEVDWDYISQDI